MHEIEHLIVERRDGRLGHEEKILSDHAERLGIPVTQVTEKLMARGFVKLLPTDLVAGSVTFMRHAVRAYGKDLDELQIPDYPSSVEDSLLRTVRKDLTLNQAKELLDKGQRWFIKPQDCKIFSGFVANDSGDPRFNGVSGQRKVYLSEPVQFVTEWRYYVAHGVVMCCGHYDGNPKLSLSFMQVTDILRKFYVSGEAPAGFAADFGLMADGRIALIEINDGFSVGYYRTEPEPYWRMIAARWQQLIGANK